MHMFGTGLHFLFAVYLPADVRLFLECFFYEPVVGPCLWDIYIICQQYRWNAFMEPFWVLSAVMIYLKKSRIILYRVIWLLRRGALLLCVKLNKYGFQHMESESFFRITLKESFVVFNFSSWSEGERFC